MKQWILSCLLIAALVAGGCQSGTGSSTITEYRPSLSVPPDTMAPQSGVYELVRWTPIASLSPTTQTTTLHARPRKQMPVDVEEVYVSRAKPLGFRRHAGQLLSIADQNIQALPDAHYEWRSLDGNAGNRAYQRERRGYILESTVAVIGILMIAGALLFYYLHENRHGDPSGN